uniref:Uncharacterized protein n=1 Tax=Spongospora subterranea TaxID=70186 RepID=A0A0H5RSG3_9EUKA|eukprot:CRZ11679.1 hypothetical protein [Spongospora subterranea]
MCDHENRSGPITTDQFQAIHQSLALLLHSMQPLKHNLPLERLRYRLQSLLAIPEQEIDKLDPTRLLSQIQQSCLPPSSALFQSFLRRSSVPNGNVQGGLEITDNINKSSPCMSKALTVNGEVICCNSIERGHKCELSNPNEFVLLFKDYEKQRLAQAAANRALRRKRKTGAD